MNNVSNGISKEQELWEGAYIQARMDVSQQVYDMCDSVNKNIILASIKNHARKRYNEIFTSKILIAQS